MARINRVSQEIPDPPYEQVLQRVCAIDVAKEFGQVCVRVPRPDGGRRVSTVSVVDARTSAVLALGASLSEQGIEKVTLESTSDYWRIFFYLLEACGLNVQLVNAREVKNVPGRPKTDVLDCVWLAKLTERGMLRPSFVPPPAIRVLRDYTRTRYDLTRDRTRHWQRLEKLLEDALIKVTAVASKITTASVRDMIDALIHGERDPYQLAGLARGRMRSKNPELVAALDGRFDTHHAELATIWLGQIDNLTTDIDNLTTRIEQLVNNLPHPAPTPPGPTGHTGNTGPKSAAQRLADIPGLSPGTAHMILAEIGTDMSHFPTPHHLTAWARLTPQVKQSGTKHRTGKTGYGNPYLRNTLSNAAASASRGHTFLAERYRRIVKRRGKGKALIAVARSILTIIWHLLTNPSTTYHDLGPDYYQTHIDKNRRQRHLVHQLEALGLHVTLTPTTA